MSCKSLLTISIRYMVLIALICTVAATVSAQSPPDTPDRKLEAAPTQATTAPAAADLPSAEKPTTSDGAAASIVETNSAAAAVDSKPDATATAGQPATAKPAPVPPPCRKISADVVALPQPIMLNRLGASVPDGLVFALRSDTVGSGSNIRLRDGKRPRPLVLRANVGDCLTVAFTNLVPTSKFQNAKSPTFTTEVSLHVQGMQWLTGSGDDGSFVGLNASSLASAPPAPGPTAYQLYVKEEGTFLLYTMGDTSTQGLQLQRGLFGALNVQPRDAVWYRSQVTQQDLALATKKLTEKGQPVVDYDAVYPVGHPRAGIPILKMLNSKNQIVHSDLTAIITGKDGGRFAGTTGPDKAEPPCNAEGLLGAPKADPLFCANPASPDRKQPYREVTIIYHEAMDAVTAQAFPIFTNEFMKNTLAAGKDAFAINYGTGGISAEIYANRIGVGPMGSCVDCKFEEFFLSAWSVGDPAMLVDVPANSNLQPPLTTLPPTPPFPAKAPAPAPALCTAEQLGDKASTPPSSTCVNNRVVTADSYTLAGLNKATKAYYPDDPSNVYHSYINDHLKFRILHGGTGVSHVHHQHAHQWLQSPNSDEGSYLDSQMISPGASYTLEMTYNGSGNRNKVVGDSIFHCHFYPHFASGMWAMWRTHDVFESGTELDKNGLPIFGKRALPDGEIQAGTPIPALVPLPTMPMAPIPGQGLDNSAVYIDKGQVVYGTPANPDPQGKNVKENPGFPFFIPGFAGARAPHPPYDFAADVVNGGLMDGGLPRHVITKGSISYEAHTNFDWSKDVATVDAIKLPEDGTLVEKVAMQYHSRRCQQTFFPDGSAATCVPPVISTSPQMTQGPPTGFILNGLPLGPQAGAPFADPAVDDNGNAINYNKVTKVQEKRIYKAAAIQMDVKLNKPALGWHYSQQRMLTLWNDANDTLSGKRPPEPLFFRGNSGDIIEYWHTNLVPNYYLVDDFQVRTPTDILGQHIHLVKFDVTSSDGAGNGFNYEDGTFSPQEVQETIKAINHSATNGFVNDPNNPLKAKLPPTEIFDCAANPGDPRCTACLDNWTTNSRPQCPSWLGAQTTIQRWYLDPLVDNSNVDRTLRTVFTHDHFGPSTHQQAGLYAGLLVEPLGSKWLNSETGKTMGQPTSLPPVRPDGGPTSWKAIIQSKNLEGSDLSYREFALEFQDFQLAYQSKKQGNISPKPNLPNPNPSQGYRDKNFAIGAPSTPSILSTGTVGTHSVNYKNEPIPYRVGKGDLSEAFNSDILQPSALVGMQGDPATPLMRAYQGDNVQIRLLVGAHMFAHQFNLHGPTWFAEPSWSNSGYRSAQAMGLSEHFELLFQVPSSSFQKPAAAGITTRKCPDGMSEGNCADYLYSPSLDIYGISNGMWGLFRAYDSNTVNPAKNLYPLPNNPVGPANPGAKVPYATCPGDVNRTIRVTAVTAQKALAGRPANQVPTSPSKGQIVFNDRAHPKEVLSNPLGIMYVMTDDLDAQGQLNPGVPIEPLILRANAGDCIEVQLTNDLDPYKSDIFKTTLKYAEPLGGRSQSDILNGTTPAKSLSNVLQVAPSKSVGLHPQLLSYDAATSTGTNIGYNSKNQPSQLASYGQTVKYRWYAGKVVRKADGTLEHTPVEFGSLNLFPSDPMFQHFNGLFGSMVIEPAGAKKWECGEASGLRPCDPPARGDGQPAVAYTPPTSRASATVSLAYGSFREFVAMISDDMNISPSISYGAMKQNGTRETKKTGNSAAVNYRTEPASLRYAFNATRDFSCMTSNQLISGTINASPNGDPVTPIFTAQPGDAVRFRMTHPYGLGTSQVFTIHGHVWQRNPYTNKSRDIGDNSLSQWLGSRDNHGSTDHFDLTIDKAGGEALLSGDHLYSVFLPGQANLGPWGIFRVGTPYPPTTQNPACKVIQPSTGTPYEIPKQVDRDMLIRKPINDPAPSRP
jgi:hypothetical protein